MIHIRTTYSSLVTLILASALATNVGAQPLAKGQSKFLGCSMSTIYPNFGTYFNQVTPENAGKWQSVEGSAEGTFSWSSLDGIYNYAYSNKFPFKDHNLVWGQQQPSWISSLDSASQRAAIEQWVDSVGQRYVSMSMIDVVNEPIHNPPDGLSGRANYKNALGGDGTTGWDWVVTTFEWARKYCYPGVKLLINEYSVLGSNTTTTTYLNLIDTLKVRGLIDGIGIQGHYFEFRSPVAATSGIYINDINTMKANLDRLGATGLPIYISEFDINEPVDSVQLAEYKIYFPMLWENPAVKGITLWGYVQGAIWRTDAYLVRTDGSERPALQWLRIYVATPAVVSPNGSTDQPRDVTLTWRRSVPATSYRVQVATDSLFSSVAVDTTVTDTLVHLSPLAATTSYYWHVSAVNSMGSSANSITAMFTTGNQIMSVQRNEQLPVEFELSQNYPNPFNPVTQISYTVPRTGHISLKVYNLLGQEVGTLVDGIKNSGRYRVTFDGTDLTSGVYFYTLQATGFVATRKLVLLK